MFTFILFQGRLKILFSLSFLIRLDSNLTTITEKHLKLDLTEGAVWIPYTRSRLDLGMEELFTEPN